MSRSPGAYLALPEGESGVPWRGRRVVIMLPGGTSLWWRATLLVVALAGFVAGPSVLPPLARAPGWVTVIEWLAGPAVASSEAPAPGSAPAARERLQAWGRWLVARATRAVAPVEAPGQDPLAPSDAVAFGVDGAIAPDGLPMRPALASASSSNAGAPPREVPARPSTAAPLRGIWVAVYHTHGSEMYRTGRDDPDDPQAYHRFGSRETGVLRVGAELVRALNEYGIPAIHVTTLHDTPDFNAAYARSLETARSVVARYPSLRLLIDLHRDAPQEGGTLVTSVDGEEVARLAIVVGTGQGGREGADNMAVARLLAEELDARFPGLLRRIIAQPGRRYNQQVHPGALLIEVGSYRSREEAAVRTARLLAQAIAAMLLRHPVPRGTWG